jgi:hypothetical protein
MLTGPDVASGLALGKSWEEEEGIPLSHKAKSSSWGLESLPEETLLSKSPLG